MQNTLLAMIAHAPSERAALSRTTFALACTLTNTDPADEHFCRDSYRRLVLDVRPGIPDQLHCSL